MTLRRSTFALTGAVLAALALRCLTWPQVLSESGVVRLALHDSAYHARRAFWTFANFPSVLLFDRYLAFPGGAAVPNPPLFDWLLGAAALPFAGFEHGFEWVVACSSPLLAALTVLPVHAVGRRLGGPGVGIGAAWLFALLPASVLVTRIGNVDHHAAVALLGASWLASSVAWVDAERAPGAARVLLRALVTAALVLTWSGSLLYVALAEGGLLVVIGILGAHPRWLRAQAASALLAALLLLPWLPALVAASGAAFSTTALSFAQPLLLAALALLAWALAQGELRRPSSGAAARALRAVALAAALLAVLAAIPGLLGELLPGLDFLAKRDAWSAGNPEQQPLFALGGGRPAQAHSALARFGLFAFGVPLLPLLAWIARRRTGRSEPYLVLVLWCLPITVLALLQLRFSNDLAAPAAIVFALALAALQRGIAARLRSPAWGATAAVLVVAALLLAPAVARVHVPGLRRALAPPPAGWLSPRESLLRFAEQVRRATPETSGYLAAEPAPEYSVLCHPSFGHTLVWAARRPTPAGNFGPYVDPAAFRAATRFYRVEAEAEAVEIATRLGARYVMTMDSVGLESASVVHRLHHADGSAAGGYAHLGRFRWVTEGPAGGRPLRLMFPRGPLAPGIPYKLFELVEGAQLELAAPAGVEVVAELGIATPSGRRAQLRATGRSDASGRVRLRLANPGRYRVRVGEGAALAAEVDERDVREGRVVWAGPELGG